VPMVVVVVNLVVVRCVVGGCAGIAGVNFVVFAKYGR